MIKGLDSKKCLPIYPFMVNQLYLHEMELVWFALIFKFTYYSPFKCFLFNGKLDIIKDYYGEDRLASLRKSLDDDDEKVIAKDVAQSLKILLELDYIKKEKVSNNFISLTVNEKVVNELVGDDDE